MMKRSRSLGQCLDVVGESGRRSVGVGRGQGQPQQLRVEQAGGGVGGVQIVLVQPVEGGLTIGSTIQCG